MIKQRTRSLTYSHTHTSITQITTYKNRLRTEFCRNVHKPLNLSFLALFRNFYVLDALGALSFIVCFIFNRPFKLFSKMNTTFTNQFRNSSTNLMFHFHILTLANIHWFKLNCTVCIGNVYWFKFTIMNFCLFFLVGIRFCIHWFSGIRLSFKWYHFSKINWC